MRKKEDAHKYCCVEEMNDQSQLIQMLSIFPEGRSVDQTGRELPTSIRKRESQLPIESSNR